MDLTIAEYLTLSPAIRVILDAEDYNAPPPPTTEEVEALPEV